MARFLPQSLGLDVTFYQENNKLNEKDKPKEKDKITIPCPKILEGEKKAKHLKNKKTNIVSWSWEMGKCVPLEKL